jgi:hypothetical protein
MPAVSQSHPAPTLASLPTTEASRLGGGTDPDSVSLVSPQGPTLFSSIHHPIPSHIPHPRHPASRQVGTIGSLCFHLPRYATVPIHLDSVWCVPLGQTGKQSNIPSVYCRGKNELCETAIRYGSTYPMQSAVFSSSRGMCWHARPCM